MHDASEKLITCTLEARLIKGNMQNSNDFYVLKQTMQLYKIKITIIMTYSIVNYNITLKEYINNVTLY